MRTGVMVGVHAHADPDRLVETVRWPPIRALSPPLTEDFRVFAVGGRVFSRCAQNVLTACSRHRE
jgi:hypothetical protein